jgi:23S rRNA pseudouridine1911/1915/1917 synthase
MSSPPLEFAVPARARGQKLDELLEELISDRSKAQLQKLVRLGRVLLNGEQVLRSNVRLSGGERLVVFFEAPPKIVEAAASHSAEASAAPKGPTSINNGELEYLHVDADLVVLSKPVGLLVQPNEKQQRDTVADLLVRRFGPIAEAPRGEKAGLVHRLDRETSGILLAARNREAQLFLVNEFRQRRVKKRYLALVHGVPKNARFEVDLALGQHPKYEDIQRPDPRGSPAFTAFEVLERFPAAAEGEGRALIACYPESGRRHQIRVHLAAVGYPIVGDKLYRPDGRSSASKELRTHALHAAGIEFRHPRSQQLTRFEAPLPADFAALLAHLRAGG